MQNQYPGQGYPPNQQWNQQPAGQYNPPPPNQGWGQQQPPYGAPPPNQYPPQQGGWGQPPLQHPPQPGGWGQPAPQGQWGPPPPQGGYGTPPPNQYQAPPPQQGWGQAPPPQANYPPPAQPYGAPPPGAHPPYGSAPPQHPHGGPPPAGHFGPATQPSLGYGPMQTANIDMSRDVETLRNAMKGFGTNEKILIGILAKKDPIQINTLRSQYDQRLMKVLIKDLEKETSGYFGKGCVQIARGPLAGDCFTLYTAMKGMGTVEAALDDVLVGRSNADMNAIKTEYQRIFQKTLESDLRGDLSADTERMYMIIIAARRNEDSAPVLPHEIEKDVTELQRAMGGMMSKNSLQVCEILINRNDAQLRAISQAYEQRFRTSLEKAIKSKFSGHMEDALVLLIQRANNRADAEAIRLEESMAGIGTKDDLLVQRVVRCHWDRNFMRAVADAYKRRYGKSLVKRIEGETRGDYERLMVACVE